MCYEQIDISCVSQGMVRTLARISWQFFSDFVANLSRLLLAENIEIQLVLMKSLQK